jgi:hypothetical protein
MAGILPESELHQAQQGGVNVQADELIKHYRNHPLLK